MWMAGSASGFPGTKREAFARRSCPDKGWSGRALRRSVAPVWPTDYSKRSTDMDSGNRRTRWQKKSKKAQEGQKGQEGRSGEEEVRQEGVEESREEIGEEGCQEGRKEIRQEGRQEVKGGRPEEGRQEEPGEEKEGGCQARRSQGGARDGGARAGAEPAPAPSWATPEPSTPVMGVRLVQRRRPQLDGRLRNNVSKGRSVQRCGLFRAGLSRVREGCPRQPESYFHGEVDSQKCVRRHVARCRIFRFQLLAGGTKTPKIVVRMQHTRRTFIETARTPKKAAMLAFFASRS